MHQRATGQLQEQQHDGDPARRRGPTAPAGSNRCRRIAFPHARLPTCSQGYIARPALPLRDHGRSSPSIRSLR
ncbi:hypothetical protein ATSB10_11100 [Dyella thiooxydans]|uniref:Uncharacterized protein n=1 Tax=Dyella thiooxydans TaxID=445710 RepID=A0A160MZJ2_9GAMM|nr:hypothetical protein ATSB10_11100 [Dyella thiooxydans]